MGKTGSGLTLDGSKSGVKIGIKRKSGNATAVQAFVFAVSNSVVTIMNNMLTDVQQEKNFLLTLGVRRRVK